MSLFDVFSTQPANNAASTNAAWITQGMNQALPWYQQGIGGIQSGIGSIYQYGVPAVQQGMNAVGQGGIGSVQQAENAITQGAIPAITQGAIGALSQGAIGALTQGAIPAVQQGVSTTGQALPWLQQSYGTGAAPSWQNFGTAQGGVNAYGNALGLGGAAGNAAAIQAFQNNPGYNFQRQQGDAAILAQQAATGGTGSGNEATALANYNQNLANTSWNNYVSNLAPYLNMSQNAAGTLANTYSGLGNAGAGIYQGMGGLQANQLAGQYGNIANQYTNIAGQYDLTANQFNNLAQQYNNQAGQYDIYGGLSANQLAGQYTNAANIQANQLPAAYQNIGNMYYGGNASIGQGYTNAQLAAYQASANQMNALTSGLSGIAGLGIGAGLLGFLSDIKIKEDIAPVGALASGETVYRYRYAGDPRFQIGLIAQEVEGSTPEAVFDAIDNLKGVDYRRATDRAAKILEFTRPAPKLEPTHRPFASELLELAA